MKDSKADQAQLLAELRRLESKPPKRADQLIARHLKCEESQSVAHTVVMDLGFRSDLNLQRPRNGQVRVRIEARR